MSTKAASTNAVSPLAPVLKLEYVKWVITLFASLLTMGIVATFIDSSYEVNITEALDKAKQLLLNPGGIAPEPKEKLLFVASIITGTLSVFLFYYLTDKYFKKKNTTSVNNLYLAVVTLSVLILVYVTYKSLYAVNPFSDPPQNAHDAVGKTNKDFYFIKTFIHKNLFLYLLFIYPAILIALTYTFKMSESALAGINKFTRYFVIVACVSMTLVVCFISTFSFPYTFENKYDFNAVYYSVVQVYNGFPLLVDNFTNTYGLYPHFVMPVLKMAGLSIYNFTLIMGVLLSICFALLFYFFNKTVANKLLVLFGFSTVFFNSYMYSRIVTNYDAYFAISPIRWIFPFLLLGYAAMYLYPFARLKTSRLYNGKIPVLSNVGITPIKLVSFFFFAIGILWNPDFGMLTFLALIAFYGYLEIPGQTLKNIAVRIVAHVVMALVAVGIVFFTYTLIIKACYGSSPQLSIMFSTINTFSGLGFYALPMPSTWHIWMIIAFIYLVGVLYSAVSIFKKTINAKSATIFLLSAMGIVFFSYYQGRSHNWNLLVTNFPALILLTIFCDELLKAVKSHKVFMLPFAVVLFMISFSFFQIAYDYDKILSLVHSKNDKTLNQPEEQKVMATSKIIDDLTQDKERVVVLSSMWYQGLYHTFSKTASAINPGFEDLFSIADYDRILMNLQTDTAKVFYEPQLFRFNDNKIQTILSAAYDVKQEFNPEAPMWYLVKKHPNANSSFTLDQSKDDVVHELFDKDLNNKVDYALGKKGKGLKINNKFSIQVIFKPTQLSNTQVTESATLLCNANQTQGLVLQQNRADQNSYIFAINNQGILCPVIPGKWNYLALEVDSNKMKCYANGRFVGNVDIKAAYQNSDAPLYLGSMNTMGGFFFGDIKELQIKNTVLDTVNVRQNWQKVSTF